MTSVSAVPGLARLGIRGRGGCCQTQRESDHQTALHEVTVTENATPATEAAGVRARWVAYGAYVPVVITWNCVVGAVGRTISPSFMFDSTNGMDGAPVTFASTV